jgi:hypothetical protein
LHGKWTQVFERRRIGQIAHAFANQRFSTDMRVSSIRNLSPSRWHYQKRTESEFELVRNLGGLLAAILVLYRFAVTAWRSKMDSNRRSRLFERKRPLNDSFGFSARRMAQLKRTGERLASDSGDEAAAAGDADRGPSRVPDSQV